MSNQQGFWALLLGTEIYTTQRAKWIYGKAEYIFNLLVRFVIFIGLFFLAFTFYINPYMGFFQLAIDVFLVFFLITFTIFGKLFFMGVGALIRIGEVLEVNSKNITSPYGLSSSQVFPQKMQNQSANFQAKSKNDDKEVELIQVNKSDEELERDRFNQLRIEITQEITKHGHAVSMSGEYPNNKWEIKFKDGKSKRISNFEELKLVLNEIKN